MIKVAVINTEDTDYFEKRSFHTEQLDIFEVGTEGKLLLFQTRFKQLKSTHTQQRKNRTST